MKVEVSVLAPIPPKVATPKPTVTKSTAPAKPIAPKPKPVAPAKIVKSTETNE